MLLLSASIVPSNSFSSFANSNLLNVSRFSTPYKSLVVKLKLFVFLLSDLITCPFSLTITSTLAIPVTTPFETGSFNDTL